MKAGVGSAAAYATASSDTVAGDGTYEPRGKINSPHPVIACVGEVDIAVGIKGNVAGEMKGCVSGRGAFA